MSARRPPPPESVFAVRRALVAPRARGRAVSTSVDADLAVATSRATALAWLAARDADRSLAARAGKELQALFGAFDSARDHWAACAEPVRTLLRAAIDDRSIPDERKLDLLPLLEACGESFHPDALGRSFRQPERARRAMVGRRLAELPATAETIDRELRLAGARGPWPGPLTEPGGIEALLAVGAIAAEYHPALAALFLPAVAAAALHAGVGVDRAAEVLGTAAATRHPFALTALRALAELPAAGALGAQARRWARSMERDGVEPGVPAASPFTRGWVTIVDGTGSRQLGLLFRAGRDRAALQLLLNDQQGIRDVFFVPSGGARLARGLELATGVGAAPADLPFARTLIGDALARHAALQRPVPASFLLYLSLQGEGLPAQRAHEPDLAAYVLDRWPRSATLVAGSELLARLPLCEELYCASDEAYAVLAARMRRDGVARVHFDVDASTFRVYLSEIAAAERELLTRRLAINLEVEARAGRAQRHENRALARVVVALAERIVPFEEIPFVQALNAAGMGFIAQNVALGHRSQREANAAAEGP